MFPAAESTIRRLDDARQRWWFYSFLCGLLLAVAISIAALVIVVLADVLMQLPLGWLRLLFVTWFGTSAALLWRTIRRSIKHPRSLEGAARRVELSFPDLDSSLINLIQLSRSADRGTDSFQQSAITEVVSQASHVPFFRAAYQHSRWARWRLGLHTARDLAESIAVAGLMIGFLGFLALAIPKWSSSLERLMTPWRFVPQVGLVEIIEVTPGDTRVLIGTPLTITAKIAKPGAKVTKATLRIRPDGGEETDRPMLANAAGDSFSTSLPAVAGPLQYHLQIGDSQSEVYRVTVIEEPAFEDIEVTYQYPAYLDKQDSTVRQKHADLEAPQYTKAHLKLACSSPLAQGYAQTSNGRVHGQLAEDRQTLQLRMQLSDQTSYTIHLLDTFGFTNSEPRVNTIRILPDSPPTVQIVKPSSEMNIALRGEVELIIRAGDDHGLGEVRLEWKRAASEDATIEPPIHELHRWSALAGSTSSTLSFPWILEEVSMEPGQTILVRAVALDRRQLTWRGKSLEPQRTASAWRAIHLIDASKQTGETLARLEDLHAKLWAIFQMQFQARLLSGQVDQKSTMKEATSLAKDVHQRQVQVQTASSELAESMGSQGSEHETTVRQALGRLAHNEMLRAAEQAESICEVGQESAIREGLPSLMVLQDQIIDQLRRLLDAARRALSESLAEMKDRAGGDMPSDVQGKLHELAQKLQEFTRQQRRVIEATENLAKRPVEDFSEAQEQLLKELASIEDEWARFMEEIHSDLSKLPEQDFANPSLLKELVEVQTEIKMAADALTKKSVDIAVPLEQLGAEMAEELVTNIEKWLPDTPDRERWSQEEPLTDEMKEAPMAELPGELEDLVGELMEEEESLFDEMEDLSSSWADSIDKGAGWDAMDGPISNMSAKGVTGNRLPNTSEIGGRSGEGRQGKASGEFVADSAVGKGGRKTPSRLAPDPIVQGQVQDLSKDPVGGATGGGKASGVGGEGLEGPVPNSSQPIQRDLQRMAAKQAVLRNRAESIDLKFQVLNYHPTDLRKMMELMAAVERDLKSGRYRNALRHRDVMLDGLQNIKTYLEGEFKIRQDQTSNLPGDIQREILSSMQETSPQGWESLNREYFKRLSGSETE
ncbi:MAG: hypothetical protein JW829_10950 [Pirellulales bacterium]|nr:hypothetical protein [Pirellulales bacterium]